MSHWNYDRLSALDASFLEIEDDNAHMHIGSVGLYDAAPLTLPNGGLDFERIVTFLEGQMHRVPRFRQKLATVPGLDHPVWIDDETFNIHYHVRHTALPAGGSLRLLKRLAGRIMSQQLDRGKPLWETWFVEGVEGDRFGLISKIHHCMADGISGTDLATATLGTSPDFVPEPGLPWQPRPAPSQARLLADELSRRAALPLGVARAGIRALSEPVATLESLRESVRGLSRAATAGFGTVSETPLNAPIGPHRRFDWSRIDFPKVKEIGKRVDAKVNDVVLAVVTGVVREFMEHHQLDPKELDFRAMVPVSVRSEDEHGKPGNRVSSLIVPLPLDELDPLERLRRIVETTRELKASGQSLGMQAISEVMELSDTLTQLLARAASQSQAANLVVTNVPGPPVPLYFLGARLIDAYPLVPLAANQALGVALFSYAGGLHWGLNADWDRVPDLHDVALSIGTHFAALVKAVEERA
jgi:diacylglycerol O-acyltransferase